MLLFTVVFISSSIPVTAEIKKDLGDEQASLEVSTPTSVSEIINQRTDRSKNYKLSDGSFQAVISSDVLHYIDENGKYQDINTTLIDEANINSIEIPMSQEVAIDIKSKRKDLIQKDSDYIKNNTSYRSLQIPFDVNIPKRLDKGYAVGKGKERLLFSPVNVAPVLGQVENNKITYIDAWQNTDLQLEVINSGLKETLILKNEQAPKSFVFEVKGPIDELKNLTILPAWLMDSNNEMREVQQKIYSVDGKVFLELIADFNNLIYPVIIDPTIILASNSTKGRIYKSGNSWPPQSTTIHANTFEMGIGNYNGNIHWSRQFLKFDTSNIPSNATINSVKLALQATCCGGITNSYRTEGRKNFNIYKQDYGTLDANDWDGGELIGSFGPITSGTNSIDFPTNSINIGGITSWKFTFMDESNPGTTNNLFHQFFSGSTDPVLVVDYTVPPQVLTPNGGETIDAQYTITWNPSVDPNVTQSNLKYQIQLSTNGGSTWSDIVALTSPGVTSYNYDFSSISNSTTSLIRIRVFNGTSYGPWDQSDATFTIRHNTAPNTPMVLVPGSSSSSNPAFVVGETPVLTWNFSDPDPGNTQSAFQMQIHTLTDTLTYDSDWINSSNTSFTVPTNKLTRGTTYKWRVRVKDNVGVASAYSVQKYLKANRLPQLQITSYSDNQIFSDNQLTFKWVYTDADSHVQEKFQLQGSKDNWATIAYNSNEIVSNALSHSGNFSQGEWDFRIRVFDGFEWSSWQYRSNLNLPNSFEPNDSFETAFPIQYASDYHTLISTASDVDVYKYTASHTGVNSVTLQVPTGVNYLAQIFNQDMDLISDNSTSETIYRVESGKTYYIKVISSNGFDTVNPYILRLDQLVRSQTIQYQYDDNGNLQGSTIIETW